jgi:hypothetical protein
MPAVRLALRSLSLVGAILVAAAAAIAAEPANLATKGESGWFDFALYSTGIPIGHHRIRYRHEGQDLFLTYETDVSLSFAFITIAKFNQTISQTWRGGKLQSLEARTVDGDAVTEVRARATPQGLKVDGPAGSFLAPADTAPTFYWDPRMLGKTRILDVEKGKLIDVVFEREGEQMLSFEGRTVPADVIRISGDKSGEFAWTRENEIVLREIVAQGRRIAFVREASGVVPAAQAAQVPASRR